MLYQKKTIYVVLVFIIFEMVFFGYTQKKAKIPLSGINRYEVECCKGEILEEFQSQDMEGILSELSEKRAQEDEFYSSTIDEKTAVYEEAVEELYHQALYINQFGDMVDEVIEQADSMNNISIFGKENSFASKNIEKTKQDYMALKSVEPVFFSTAFLEYFFQFTPVSYIALLCVGAFVLALLQEQRKGFRCLIFSTYRGRGRLVVSTVGAILGLTVCTTVLLYGLTFLISFWLYGKGNTGCFLSYPIQSVQMFSKLTWNISIGEFLIVYVLFKCLIIFLISLLFWFVLFVFEHYLLSFGVIVGLAVIQYLFYVVIDNNSPVNVLKYVNLFYCMNGANTFVEYRNFHLFSNAIGKNMCIFTVCCVILVLLFLLSFMAGQYKYPISSSTRLYKWLEDKIRIVKCRYFKTIEKFNLFGIECYKVFSCQKGLLILAVLLLFAIYNCQSDFSQISMSGVQEKMLQFMEEYEGEPGEESEQYILNLENTVNEVEEEYQRIEQQYEKGQADEEQLMIASIKYENFRTERELLIKIKEQRDYLMELKEQREIEGWYLNEYGYSYLIGGTKEVDLILFTMGIVLLCSGMYAFEDKCKIREMIRATEKGRRTVFRKKMQTVFAILCMFFAVNSVIEIASAMTVYGLSGFAAPVQSLRFLSFVSIPCSIGSFIIGIYVCKFLMMGTVACVTCWLSEMVTQKMAIALSGILFLPSVLYLAGVNFLSYFSIINVVGVTPLLLKTKNIILSILVYFIFALIGAVCFYMTRKRWCGEERRL